MRPRNVLLSLVAVLTLAGAHAGLPAQEVLPDPTQPPARFGATSPVAATAPVAEFTRLRFTLTGPGIGLATLSGDAGLQRLTTGDRLGDSQIVAVRPGRLLLRDETGRLDQLGFLAGESMVQFESLPRLGANE